jgi:hypothetical protein
MERDEDVRARLPAEVRDALARGAGGETPPFGAYSDQAQAWLALAELWTPEAARDAAFPLPSGTTPRGFFDSASRDGLCEWVDPAQTMCRMPAPLRGTVLRRLLQDPKLGPTYLARQISLVGKAFQRPAIRGRLGMAITRWSDLAALVDPYALPDVHLDRSFTESAAARLGREMDAIFRSPGAADTPFDDLDAVRKVNTTLRWIEAARPIAELLGGPLVAEIDRAGKRAEIFSRRLDDRRRLARFYRRQAQVDAFDAVLKSPANEWALHYCGDGGMGKTMLLRYLNSVYGPGEKHLATTRIEFDHIDPDYPARAPALLILQLTEELRLQDEGGAVTKFEALDQSIRNLHARLGGTAQPWEPMAELNRKEFDTVLDRFSEAIQALGKAQVVFLIDTCEELSKLRIDGVPPDNVTATFNILERLHERVGSLRVVFGGRRPLAGAYAGDAEPIAADSDGGSSPYAGLPPRRYMRRFQVVGFEAWEAKEYLDQCRRMTDASGGVADVPNEVQVEAILAATRLDPPAKEKSAAARHNPHELARLADWVKRRPDLTPAQIGSSDNAREYVEDRILGQLRHPALVQLLPAVALLEEFDQTTLYAATDVQDSADAWRELRWQEWINSQGGFLAVEPWLRRYLRDYYALTENAPLLVEPRRRAVAYLTRFTAPDTEADLEVVVPAFEWVDVRHLALTLRLLADRDQAAALRWWAKFERRIALERAHDRALEWTGRLLGDDGPAQPVGEGSPPSALLRAAIMATRAAAFAHRGQGPWMAEAWIDVESDLRMIPDPSARENLRRRAVAGQVAAARFDARIYLSSTADDFFRDLDKLVREAPFSAKAPPVGPEQNLVVASIGAIDALVELAEMPGAAFHGLPPSERDRLLRARAELRHNLAARLRPLVESTRPRTELEAFVHARVVRASQLAEGRTTPDHVARLEAALRAAAKDAASRSRGAEPGSGPWVDWHPPEHFVARIALEYLRAGYPSVFSPIEIYRRVIETLRTLRRSAADAERAETDILRKPFDAAALAWPKNWAVTSIDVDRLGGAVVRLVGAWFSVDDAEVKDMLDLGPEKTAADDRFLSTTHRAFPRALVAAAETMAGAGFADHALAILGRHKSEAQAADDRFGASLDIERTSLRVRRRMRLFEVEPPTRFAEYARGSPGDQSLLVALRALDAFRPGRPQLPEIDTPLECDPWEWRHIHWRGARPDFGQAQFLLNWMREQAGGFSEARAGDRHERAVAYHWLLDRFEAVLLAGQHGFPGDEFELHVNPGDLDRAAAWASAEAAADDALTLLVRLHALRSGSDQPVPGIDALVQRLGVRRAALIALSEGELLALRLPARATGLLDQSRRWSESAGAVAGSFLAQATKLLCYPRDGLRSKVIQEDVERDLNLLKEIYTRLTTRIGQLSLAPDQSPTRPPVLPPWADLGVMADGVDATRKEEFWSRSPSVWKPWLERVVAVLAWHRDGGRAGDRCRRWSEQIGATDPDAPAESALPAELDAWLLGESSRSTVDRSASDSAREVLGSSKGESAFQSSVPVPKGPILNVERAALVIKPLELGRPSEFFVQLKVQLVNDLKEAGSRSMPSRVAFDLPIGPLHRTARYRDLLKPLGESVRLALSDSLLAARSVRLEVEPEVADVGWEGAFAELVASRSPIDVPRFDHRCTLGTTRSRNKRISSMAGWVLLVGESESLLSGAQRAWLVEPLEVSWAKPRDIREAWSRSKEGFGALHLCGRAVWSNLGVSFESGGDRPYDLELLEAYVTRTWICIVHSIDPVGTQRGVSERERAGALRALAANLYVRGAACVLVIPPIPPPWARQIIAAVAAAATRADAGPMDRQVVERVSFAVNSISKAMPRDDPADWGETINDVCVYAPPF